VELGILSCVYLAKVTLRTEYKHYSQLFTKWAMPDHVIMRV